MTRTVLAAAVLTTSLLGAPAALADDPCDGGVTGPAKPALHALEGPAAAAGLDGAVHAAECALP